jgi:hypothetical protein
MYLCVREKERWQTERDIVVGIYEREREREMADRERYSCMYLCERERKRDVKP